MIYVHVQHSVEDYEMWRTGFDDHASMREASGATGEVTVMRDVDNPNYITLLMGWDDLSQAQAFTQSPELKEAMKNAGVTSAPEVRFLEVD